MHFDTFVDQITTGGFQAIHLTAFLIGVYIVWRFQPSRRAGPVVALVR